MVERSNRSQRNNALLVPTLLGIVQTDARQIAALLKVSVAIDEVLKRKPGSAPATNIKLS